MNLTQHTPLIWTIENFLSEKESDDLIVLSEMQGYEEAKVSLESGATMIKGLRNNYRTMYDNQELANQYWKRLKDFCPNEIEGNISLGLNEKFRFYKYESNQRFKRHIDGRFKRNEQEESRITFMIYLNDDFVGGETTFDNISIKPKSGTALCFIHEQKHEGCPVTQGTKYVLRSDVVYEIK